MFLAMTGAVSLAMTALCRSGLLLTQSFRGFSVTDACPELVEGCLQRVTLKRDERVVKQRAFSPRALREATHINTAFMEHFHDIELYPNYRLDKYL